MSEIKYIEPQQEATLYGSVWGAEKQKHCVRDAYTFSEEKNISATQRQLINKIHPTASDEYEMLISTYMLQLPDKSTLENFLLKELNERGEE